MDATRGLAVLLVVLYHSATNMHYADLEAPAWVWSANRVFAPVRMPTLVFLSGLLLAAGLRKGPAAFLRGKARNLAWPYLVWVSIYFVLSYPVFAVAAFLLGGTTLWYVLFLLVFYVAALLLQRVPTGVVIAVALVGSALAPDSSKWGERLLFLFAFFMAGHWAATHPGAWARVLTTRWAWALAGAVIALSAVLIGTGVLPQTPSGYGPTTTALSAAGIVLVICAARAGGDAAAAAPFRFAGRHSIIYYVTHFPTIYVGTHIIDRVPGASGGLAFVALFGAAVLVATALALAVERRPQWRLQWLFAFPARGSAATA